MTMVMTYGETTFAASRDPIVGGFAKTRSWKSPSIRSGGGQLFVHNKGTKQDTMELTWNPIDPTDLTNLLAFIDVIDGSGAEFYLTDPSGATHTAMYLGPDLLNWTPSDLMDRELTIELLIT